MLINGKKDKAVLYVRSMGKLLEVSAMFFGGDDPTDRANQHMSKNRDHGVIAEPGEIIMLANVYSQGVKIKQGAK